LEERGVSNPKDNRQFLKGGDWDAWAKTETDQVRKVPMPEVQKAYPESAETVDLISPEAFTVGSVSLADVIRKRTSKRLYTAESMTLEELSYLLWATQGVKKDSQHRTVPSAGARHPFETYLSVHRVAGLRPGLYRYLPLEHRLLVLNADKHLSSKVAEACRNQKFAAQSAVTFIWTAVPYRSEWRYDVLAAKVIALDAGHLCQNLYLAAESIACGACAIGAYNQDQLDALLGVDGADEFAVYIAAVGKVN
jgi:SagB-type dehydrogenase family enzyme